MTQEQRTALIQKLVLLLLLVAAGIAAWFYQKPADKPPEEVVTKVEVRKAPAKAVEGAGNPAVTHHAKVPKDPTPKQIDAILQNVKSPDRGVAIIHCHLPGDPASEQLADTFNQIQKKYGKLVTVTRVGFATQPKDWQAQKGVTLPYVMMIAGTENVFQFQGLWSYAKVEKKVEEVIFGLRRVGKDWRPAVPGMKPKGS